VPLSPKEICQLTGHETTDAVRMAMKRGGATLGVHVVLDFKSSVKRAYEESDVWRILGSRILDQAEKDPKVRDLAWKWLEPEIRRSVVHNRAAMLYPQALASQDEGSEN
jgi:hypothetical protein